jgi:hypothetical protein
MNASTASQPLSASDRVARLLLASGGAMDERELLARLCEWQSPRVAQATILVAVYERRARYVDVRDGERVVVRVIGGRP